MATSAARRGSVFLYLALLFFAIGIFLLCTKEVVIGIVTAALGVIAMFDVFDLLGIIGTPGVLLILGAVMMINYLRR